jgi:hypothetical protein
MASLYELTGQMAYLLQLLEDPETEEYLIPQEPKVDKKAIIAFVKEHGDTDYAQLIQSESFRIR